ncbi:growth hormone secretagogue receptor type 1-like [Poecilia reticulata]|uniref:growth hormone secretagogue receptor type 1-like n=1 Tax=Poecilia reticulata TaxID=8081 RepID=UPI0004A4187A|nr:PREDICTED: growth hormone secretagogue receptor type 1-like [Poecilia reticulata]
MTNNDSLYAGKPSGRLINDQVIFVQVLVAVLLCINLMLIITFFMKEMFYTNMRYILFANALFSDCINIIMTNVLLLFVYFSVPLQTWSCLLFFILSSMYNYVTPLTLTAMSLERYVAICLPLRHAELCTAGRALQGILIIHSLSIIPFVVFLLIFFSSVTVSFFKQYVLCTAQVFFLHRWQNHVRSAVSQFYFLIMCILIAFSYVQIMKVAKAASGENKESTRKGLRTVILHAFQLFLCLIQLWVPFIETAVLQIDLNLYINVRYFNYICLNLAPRCLSPLIYGLRDEVFLVALKHYVFHCPFIDTVKR